MMSVNIGGGQQALAVESAALSLINALGGKQETADNIKAFSEARQEAEGALEALARAKADQAEQAAILEAREQAVATREEASDKAEKNFIQRTEEFDRLATQRLVVLDTRALALAQDRGRLTRESKALDLDAVARAKDLDDREELILAGENQVKINLAASEELKKEAQAIRDKYDARMTRLLSMANEDQEEDDEA